MSTQTLLVQIQPSQYIILHFAVRMLQQQESPRVCQDRARQAGPIPTSQPGALGAAPFLVMECLSGDGQGQVTMGAWLGGTPGQALIIFLFSVLSRQIHYFTGFLVLKNIFHTFPFHFHALKLFFFSVKFNPLWKRLLKHLAYKFNLFCSIISFFCYLASSMRI